MVLEDIRFVIEYNTNTIIHFFTLKSNQNKKVANLFDKYVANNRTHNQVARNFFQPNNSYKIYTDHILNLFTYLQWSKLQQQSQTMKNLQSGGVSLSHLQKFGNNEDILR